MPAAIPACSVLLPVRNAADTLAGCLDSIAQQTFTDFELVVVDDGSTDDSSAMLQQFALADSRVRLYRTRHQGLVAALNTGLAQCRSRLVARMDADDQMRPQRLARQVRTMTANPDIDVLGSQVALVDGPTTAAGFREYVRWQNACVEPAQIAHQRFIESPLAHPSVMFRRARVLAAGGYREGDFPEDYELWLRLLHDGARIEKLPEVLLDWRDEPGRLSRSDPRCARESFDRLRARWLARDPRVVASRDRLMIWGAGRPTRKRAQRLLARGFAVRAWIDIDPRKIGNVIDGVPVIAPPDQPTLRDAFVLCYVTNHGAREQIAGWLARSGRVEGVDWLAVG